MNTYESIKSRINSYVELQETHLQLMNAFNLLSAAEFSESEINNVVFSEYDALDAAEVDEDCAMYQEIRDLQHDIVAFFVDFNN